MSRAMGWAAMWWVWTAGMARHKLACRYITALAHSLRCGGGGGGGGLPLAKASSSSSRPTSLAAVTSARRDQSQQRHGSGQPWPYPMATMRCVEHPSHWLCCAT